LADRVMEQIGGVQQRPLQIKAGYMVSTTTAIISRDTTTSNAMALQ
jgi:hypothetical protein